ncbi:MAG: UPF0182 family protein, partial [Firmicutes bacterium]|nr:UPF0182 family protein [Bacillota bacterium]
MERPKRGFKLRIAIAVIAVLIAITYALTGFLTDLMWFRETGYVSVFFTELLTKIKLGIPAVLVIALLMWVFLSALKKTFLSKGGYKLDGTDEKKLRKAGIALSLIFSIIVSAGIISRLWWQILQFL